MNCNQIQETDAVERYVQNTLSPEDASAFEEHYFSCDDCNANLQSVLAARDALIQHNRKVVEMPKPAAPSVWRVVALIAAAILMATAIWQMKKATDSKLENQAVAPVPKPNRLIELARYEAPKFEAVTLRGQQTEGKALFNSAMKDYAAGDYAKALAGLNKTLERDNTLTAAHFFNGACHLLLGHANDAIAQMQLVMMDNDSPFLEEARWASAKAWIRKGDTPQARSQLDAIIASKGDFAARATALRAAIE